MSSINPIYYKSIFIIVIKCLWLLLLLFVSYILINPVKKKRDLYEYKIHSFFFTKVKILLYILIYIIFVWYLRFTRLNAAIDLKICLHFITRMLNPLHGFNLLFVLVTILCSLFIFFIGLVKLNKFFIKEIKKYHLYLEYNKNVNGTSRPSKYYIFINHKYVANFSYKLITSAFVGFIIKYIYFIKPMINTIIYIKRIRFILKIIPVLLLIFLWLFDCYFNNFVITKVFTYMLWYIPYILWYKITTFLWYEDPLYSSILYEQYYCKDRMMYVNSPEHIEENLKNFVYNGLQNYALDNGSENTSSADWAYLQTNNRYFSLDGKVYTNDQGEGFREEA